MGMTNLAENSLLSLYEDDPEEFMRRVVTQDFNYLKGSLFLKNRHFIIQERFNKLTYRFNTNKNVAPDSL